MPATDFIGLTGPKFEMDVERGKIREFAKASHAPIPAYLEGYHPVIPPTFLITTGYIWGYTLERPRGTVFEQIDHDFSVPLHAEESFEFFAPLPRAGDRLNCVSSLEDVRIKVGSQGGDLTFLTMLTTYHDGEGQLIAEQRSTTVTTSNAPDANAPDGAWDVTVPPYEPHYESIDGGDPLAELSQQNPDNLVIGEGPGAIHAGPLQMRDMVRYQGAEGENNPLHYDIPWAKSFGYPAVFGLGMHQASTLSSYAVRWLGTSHVKSFKARFRNVYWPGDPLVYGGVISDIREEDGQKVADLTLNCTRTTPGGDSDPIVDAWMTVGL
jgi:acyl dehydratase